MQREPPKLLFPSGNDLSPEEADLLAKKLKAQLRKGLIPNASPKQLKLMVAGLGDKRGLIRRIFSESLGLVGKIALPELQEALLNNENVIRRRAAAKTIKLIGDPSSLPYLLKAVLNDQDPVVQGSSIGAMAIFGKDAVAYLLKVLLNPKSTEMQCGLAAWGLSFIGKEASESLKNAAHSDQPKVKAAAISALGDQIQYLNDIEAKNLLISSIDDPFIEVQVEAIKLIGKLEEAEWAAPYLINKLDSCSSQIKKDAAISLMELNIFKSIDNLKNSLLEEKDPLVARVFELAIKRLSK